MTTLDVAIVNYNTRELLRQCLESVRRAEPGVVVVVDHGSTDGSIAMLRSEFPNVVLEVNPANPGYGAGANRAIRRTSETGVLLLNSDTVLEPGALTVLRTYLDSHPRAGLVGPRLRNPDGTLQRSCYHFLTPFQMLVAQTGLARLFSVTPVLRDRFLPASPHDTARVVPWVKGAALVIRRTAFEAVGGFDETFFMYAEELDLCYRLKEAGWETHFAPVTDVVHVEAASTAQHRARMEVKLFDSVHLFYRRHYTRARLQQLRLVVASVMAQRIAHSTLQLSGARTPSERARAVEDLVIWRRVLSDVRNRWGRPELPDDRAHGEPVGV